MKAPCLECEHAGCGRHAECEKYQAYDKQRKAINEKRQQEAMVDAYVTDGVYRAKRSSLRYRKARKA